MTVLELEKTLSEWVSKAAPYETPNLTLIKFSLFHLQTEGNLRGESRSLSHVTFFQGSH